MRQSVCFASPATPFTPSSSLFPPPTLQTFCPRPTQPTLKPQRRARVSMGLFGLGFPELVVIAGVGIFIFGPGKISELGKDLGGVAGGVKKATAEFKEAMEESLKEADLEIERKKSEKEVATSKTVDAATKPVDEAS